MDLLLCSYGKCAYCAPCLYARSALGLTKIVDVAVNVLFSTLILGDIRNLTHSRKFRFAANVSWWSRQGQ